MIFCFVWCPGLTCHARHSSLLARPLFCIEAVMNEPRKLSEEDQARVDAYLNLPQHRRERTPFRPWTLMLVLVVALTILTGLSVWFAWIHGVRVL